MWPLASERSHTADWDLLQCLCWVSLYGFCSHERTVGMKGSHHRPGHTLRQTPSVTWHHGHTCLTHAHAHNWQINTLITSLTLLSHTFFMCVCVCAQVDPQRERFGAVPPLCGAAEWDSSDFWGKHSQWHVSKQWSQVFFCRLPGLRYR